MPPVFVVHTSEDKSVPVENTLMLYAALSKTGVPAEIHVHERGAHGFGFEKGLGTTSAYPVRMEEWLHAHGWIDR